MSDNGILARIPGQYVADALKTLPSPEDSLDDLLETEIDVPDIGRVRFVAERNHSKRGKFVYYFWSAKRATLVE